jgi:hypothetical protein
VIGSLLFCGLYVMLLIYALPPEHKAGRRLAQQLAGTRGPRPADACYQGSELLVKCVRVSMSLIL